MSKMVSYTDSSDLRPDSYWDGGGTAQGDATFQRVSPATPLGLVGEHLPPLKPGEVEIAMIGLHTSMGEVISIRARPSGDKIRYRVVDEAQLGYGAEEPTEYAFKHKSSAQPLTFKQMTNLLWSLEGDDWKVFVDQWEQDAEEDDMPEERDGFFVLHSDFYEGLNDWLDTKYKEWRASE